MSERTAGLSETYEGSADYFGISMLSEEEQYEKSRVAHLAGWQIGTHANGDVTIDELSASTNFYEREFPRKDPRFRLEHCTLIDDSLVARIKALGAIPTPFSSYADYHGEKMHFYGAERLKNMFALRSFLDAGVPATQASDYTASPFEPIMALQSEVTRTNTEARSGGPTNASVWMRRSA